MRSLLLVLSLSFLCAHSALAARIYSQVDEQGHMVFTDTPAQHSDTATTVELKPTNAMPATLRTIKLSPPKPQPDTPKTLPYTELQLLNPEPDLTVRNTAQRLEVEVSSIPALQAGHHYQLWLNGAAFGPASHSTHWPVDGVERGRHSLQVHIVDADERSLIQSTVTQVQVRQTTLADRRRVRPCQTDDYGQRPECPLKDKPKNPKRPWWRLGF